MKPSIESWGRSTFRRTIYLEYFFWHLWSNLQKLNDFLNFFCVLAYEYFDDTTFRRLFCETFMEPSVGSLGVVRTI